MSELHETLQTFLLGKQPNSWLRYEKLNVYVRKGFHHWDSSTKHTLDVANIDVPEPYKGQGIFTKWLSEAETLAYENGLDAVYVESLLNPRLANFLTRRGYTLIEPSMPPCYYLMFT